MFPVIPLLGGLASLLGVGTLVWYYNLSHDERAEADRLTARFARELYQKAVDDLSRSEARIVHDRVRAYFDN
jgi:hypothetical protein